MNGLKFKIRKGIAIWKYKYDIEKGDFIMLLSLISALILGTEYIKEQSTPVVPTENWGNKDLINRDRLNPNVSNEQFMKNLQNGKYRTTYPAWKTEPHRDAMGRVFIENCKLFEEDKFKYGVEQAYQWAEWGKYNL